MSRDFAGKRYRDILPILQEGSIRLNRAMLTLGGFQGPGYIQIEDIIERQLEALLVLGIYDNRFLAELSSVQQGVIVLDLDAVDIGVDSVSFDHIGSGIAMVQHFYTMGKRRIAFVGRPIAPPKPAQFQRNYDSCGRERYEGYLAGLRACGLKPEESLIKITSGDSGVVQTAVEELIALAEPPDAVVAESPRNIIMYIKDAGLAEKIPVAGWAAEDVYASRGPAMACAALVDFEPLGIAAMDVLSCRLENPEGPVQRCRVFPKIMGPDSTVLVEQ
jgi:DNA-binding LacI/PurR family transcriptional regulator